MSFDPFDGEGSEHKKNFKKIFKKISEIFINLISRSSADYRGIMQNSFRTKTEISLGFKIEIFFHDFSCMIFRDDFSCTILNLISDVQYTSLKYDYKPHRIDYEKQGILGIGCTQLSIEDLWYP